MKSNNKCVYCGSEVKGKRKHFCSDICNPKYWAGVYSRKWKVGTSIVMPDDKPTEEEIAQCKIKYHARRVAYKKYELGKEVKCDLCRKKTKHAQRHHEDYDMPEVFMVICTTCHGFIKRYNSLKKMLYKKC